MVQTMKRSRKQRIDAAIAFALDRRWDLAAAENQALLAEFPDDIEAANRLGKSLTELGDLEGAMAAYQRTLERDSTNVIARRNLTRIEEMKDTQPKRRPPKRSVATSAGASVETVRAHSLIEESGKSAEFDLIEPDTSGLSRVSAGEPAELVPTPRGILVRSTGGADLGYIEPRAGLRLRRLIEGGNRYAAVIRRVIDSEIAIYVRETHRDPSLVDQPSFLTPATSGKRRLAPRAYTKPSIVRYQADSSDAGDDSDDDDSDSSWTPRSRRSEEDEFEERGFSDDSPLGSDNDDEIEDVVADDDDEPLVDDEDDE